jgi:pilus assembly protein CpaB
LGVDDVTVLNVPVGAMVAKGVVTNPQDAVGHIANQKMYAGEWILTQKLGVDKDKNKQSIEGLLSKGYRAMRLPVTAVTGLLGILNPGDHVDIISVFESADSKRMVSRIILQDVPVLSIGQINRMGRVEKEKNKPNLELMEDKSMVTLDLKSAQAEQLALAMNVGAIHLILRNPVDTAIVKTLGFNLKTIEKGKQRPPKYKPKSKRQMLQLMQGDKVQEVQTR